MRTIKADTKPEAELAVFVGAVLGFPEIGIKQFTNRIDGGFGFRLVNDGIRVGCRSRRWVRGRV